jgi:Dyp-type peroxidase family
MIVFFWFPLLFGPDHNPRQMEDSMPTTTAEPRTPTVEKLALEEIQGNILSGFNKDYQAFLFLHFDDASKARAWLASIKNEIASTDQVDRFNKLFKDLRKFRGGELGTLKATWANIAFTHDGLCQLAAAGSDLSGFPRAFVEGMGKRSEKLGDIGNSDPKNWVFNRIGVDGIHAVLMVGSDSQADLYQHIMRYLSLIFLNGGLTLVFLQEGAVRSDQPGHEHFGFKDGVSQPGIRGFTQPSNPNAPDEGIPGQDLLWPGEFVIGYETQFGVADPKKPADLNTAPGAPSKPVPAWTRNGSYLVFRRLRQDVPAFRNQIRDLAAAHNLKPEVLEAKIVGRYTSGCPLERSKPHPNLDTTHGDPSIEHPDLLTDNINNFEYGDDAKGAIVPRAAHIRKAYPRDEIVGDGSQINENTTQKHRLLRRGIPYGTSFRPTLGSVAHPVEEENALENVDRGLLFLAYQSDIESHFEFVQQTWVNNTEFPEPRDGQDPVIAQSPIGPVSMSGIQGSPIDIKHFVTTTGGEYFFQPSISVLRKLAKGTKLDGVTD